MVAKIAIRFLFGLFGVCFAWGGAFATPAIVDYVIDGDTFGARVLLPDDIQVNVRVRIANIDTPELHGQCDAEIKMANRARDRLVELIPVGVMVDLRDITDDKYLGRIDALVTLPDGRDLSQILLNEKLSRPYDGGRRGSWCE